MGTEQPEGLSFYLLGELQVEVGRESVPLWMVLFEVSTERQVELLIRQVYVCVWRLRSSVSR